MAEEDQKPEAAPVPEPIRTLDHQGLPEATKATETRKAG
jgi:hypothetical protein